jgi:hypothetical protein
MKKILFRLLSVCCMLCCQFTAAQHFNPSDIRISLLTAAPGDELYARFGHSAIRVRISSIDYDAVYNYGSFNYDQPNFYTNFARGRMLYFLGKTSYDRFITTYMYENRRIREQVFELDSAQTMFVFHFLENNYKPENREYRYHFFYDNCVTRIRDLMLQTFPGMTLPDSQESPSFRELIHRYTKEHPWGQFGIDIALGLPTDRKTGMYEQMYLPDYAFNAFATVLYHGRPIVKQTRDIFIPDQPAFEPPGPITPTVVCCTVLALTLLFFYVRKGSNVFDFALFFIVGIVGLLVTFLWFFTDHTNTANNLNIIWALPTHIVMVFFLLPKRRSNFTRKYFLVTAIIAMLLVVTWVFLPQRLNPALIPLVLAIALRAFRIFRTVRP